MVERKFLDDFFEARDRAEGARISLVRSIFPNTEQSYVDNAFHAAGCLEESLGYICNYICATAAGYMLELIKGSKTTSGGRPYLTREDLYSKMRSIEPKLTDDDILGACSGLSKDKITFGQYGDCEIYILNEEKK